MNCYVKMLLQETNTNNCTMLAEYLDEEMVLGSPPEGEGKLKKVIHATTHNVIESPKK